MLLPILILVVLLALSAFFSGTETAFFSLTPGQREELKTARPASSRRIERLLAEPPRLLGTLLLGNLIVNSTASAVFTLLALSLARRAGASETLYVGVGGLIITGVIIVFSEVIPKLVAARGPAAFAALAALPVTAARWLFSPLVWLLTKVSSVFNWLGRPDPSSSTYSHTAVS
ncbi:MAG: DUF21 domain-containing protein [bacterium]